MTCDLVGTGSALTDLCSGLEQPLALGPTKGEEIFLLRIRGEEIERRARRRGVDGGSVFVKFSNLLWCQIVEERELVSRQWVRRPL
jgi:hypothetical protein